MPTSDEMTAAQTSADQTADSLPANEPVEQAHSNPGGIDRMCATYDGVKEHDHYAEWGDQPLIRFFPDHFISEATAMVLLLCLYSVLAIFVPAFLEVRANPAVTPVGSKPAWYFLFLYQFLHYVPPIVGTLAPVFLLVLLALWPWVDRSPERRPSKRIWQLTLAAVVVVVILTLTVMGAVE